MRQKVSQEKQWEQQRKTDWGQKARDTEGQVGGQFPKSLLGKVVLGGDEGHFGALTSLS